MLIKKKNGKKRKNENVKSGVFRICRAKMKRRIRTNSSNEVYTRNEI